MGNKINTLYKPMKTFLNRLLFFSLVLSIALAGLTGTNLFIYAQQISQPITPTDDAEEKATITQLKLPEGMSVGKKRISLDLKGVDITELFRILSLKMGLTIVPSRGVAGRVNVFLNNLTFEDTLDVILISQNLACERKDNVINVMTAAEYEALYGEKYNEKRKFNRLKLNYAEPNAVFRALGQIKSNIGKIIVDEASGTILLIDIPEKLELMSQVTADLDKPLQTEVFDIKYAKASDLKTHLTDALTSGPGELLVDERSSKVMVSDLPDKMKKIKRMIRELDEESRQVFIEAEIVQITLKDEYKNGIDWEKAFSNTDGYLHDLNLKGVFSSADITAKYQEFKVGTLSQDQYTATLQMLNIFGDTKILSRPRIAVLNNEEAKILVGVRDFYVTQTISQAETTMVTSESIEFIDVGVKLNVIPTINKDGFVTMKIKPEVSAIVDKEETGGGSRIPIVETAEAETVIKVKDNTMIMIAGLLKDDIRDERTGIPFLNRIPIIGGLFGSRSKTSLQTEIVVFLTPHIMRGDAMVKGTEPERLIPSEIVPDDLRQSIISQKIEDIKLKPDALFESLAPEAQTTSAQDTEGASDLQEKIKGIKVE